MPSVSPAQHRWIGFLHSDPAAREHSGMSKATVDEWLHADKGSPWKRAAGGIVQYRDAGGATDPTQLPGLTPTNQTTNPITAGMIQRYASMPPEKLQELAAMMGGSPQAAIIQKVLQQKRMMPNAQQQQPAQQQVPGQQAQPAPVAPVAQQPQQPTMQRRGGATPRRAMGGNMSMGQMDPSWSRSAMSQEDTGGGATGYLHGPTGGRTDAILTSAPAGSHVIPADVVSGLGEGNSMAGAGVMQRILATGPHGIPMPRAGGRLGAPRPPPLPQDHTRGGNIGGGGRGELTPVALSHGEFVVTPEQVAHWGDGDMDKGHKIFDHFIVKMRDHIIKTMKRLPPPVKAGSGK